jgi:hypothetical protein
MHPATMPSALPAESDAGLSHQEILCELQSLRDLIERRCTSSSAPAAMDDAIGRTKLEIAALHVGPIDGGPARATRELDAVTEGAERATQKIINAAEEIEDPANTLSARLKDGQEQALAQDILDHVISIFEACNFQDLNAQRIIKVVATLNFVEDRITRMMEAWGGIDAFRLHRCRTRRAGKPRQTSWPQTRGRCRLCHPGRGRRALRCGIDRAAIPTAACRSWFLLYKQVSSPAV